MSKDFDSDELLEHNVKFFGAQKHKASWKTEVNYFRREKVHKVFFPRPERDNGEISNRKLKYATRVYGTKKRVSKTKEVLEVPAVIVNDSDTDIVMTEASDDEEDEHNVSNAACSDVVDDVLEDVMNKSTDVVDDVLEDVMNKSTDVVEHVLEDVLCRSTQYVLHVLDKKDVEILRLKKLLASERIANQRKVEEACEVARSGLDGMVARFGNLHPTMLATVYSQLQQASHIVCVY